MKVLLNPDIPETQQVNPTYKYCCKYCRGTWVMLEGVPKELVPRLAQHAQQRHNGEYLKRFRSQITSVSLFYG